MRRTAVFLSALASSSLLQQLGNICLTIDPGLAPAEKAKNLYPECPLLGNRLLTLVSECIVYWADKHPLNSQHTPSKFSLLRSFLLERGVTLPFEFKYFA